MRWAVRLVVPPLLFAVLWLIGQQYSKKLKEQNKTPVVSVVMKIIKREQGWKAPDDVNHYLQAFLTPQTFFPRWSWQVFLLCKFGSQLNDAFLFIEGHRTFLSWSLIFQEILIICRHLDSFRCTEGKSCFHLASYLWWSYVFVKKRKKKNHPGNRSLGKSPETDACWIYRSKHVILGPAWNAPVSSLHKYLQRYNTKLMKLKSYGKLTGVTIH